MTRKTGRARETEREGAMLLERASGTIVERGNRGRTTVFLRADREGDIDRPFARGGRRRRHREKERERERGRTELRETGVGQRGRGGGERGPDGSERDGVSQPEECLSWQRRGSGTGSVQSSQVSPREGDILLRGAHVPRSAFFRGPYVALISAAPFASRFIHPLPFTLGCPFCPRFRCRLPSRLRVFIPR